MAVLHIRAIQVLANLPLCQLSANVPGKAAEDDPRVLHKWKTQLESLALAWPRHLGREPLDKGFPVSACHKRGGTGVRMCDVPEDQLWCRIQRPPASVFQVVKHQQNQKPSLQGLLRKGLLATQCSWTCSNLGPGQGAQLTAPVL